MTGFERLRAALAGLVAFAGAEDEALLVVASDEDGGSPSRWCARAIVAHDTEFKCEQVRRLEAVRGRTTPPASGSVDHGSEAVYRAYAARPLGQVLEESREATRALVAAVADASEADLLDPSRNPWLEGRLLWLQIVVRGFWHPTGHIGSYHLDRDDGAAALALGTRAFALCTALAAPDQAGAMALYNLACAEARSGRIPLALDSLRRALSMNSELAVNAVRDPDLAPLREMPGWSMVLATPG